MCLYVRSKFKKARRDIPVYKVFRVETCGLCSPLKRNYVWEDGVNTVYHSEDSLAEFKEESMRRKRIGAGMFHSFKKLKNARKFAKEGWFGTFHIYKCIIPKGTEYVKGRMYDDIFSPAQYGSFSLEMKKYVEEVNNDL